MRRSHVLVAAAVALTALGACGSPGKSDAGGGKVATLASAAPSASATAKPAAQRPRERLDTTTEEFEAMLGPYNKCMEEHGVGVKGGRGSGVAKPATAEQEEKADAANRICEPQYMPLPPWEKDPANPEARDFALAVVKCLKGKGVKYVEVSDDGISLAFGGDQNDARSISMGLDLAPGCERTVAAKNK
jgi:hypothetical protein